MHRKAPLLVLASLALLAASCASVDFRRTSPDAGTFRSSAWSFTLLSFDFPSHALHRARANASRSALPNLIVEHERVRPYLGSLDWLLDIISVRWARVDGTFGHPELPNTR